MGLSPTGKIGFCLSGTMQPCVGRRSARLLSRVCLSVTVFPPRKRLCYCCPSLSLCALSVRACVRAGPALWPDLTLIQLSEVFVFYPFVLKLLVDMRVLCSLMSQGKKSCFSIYKLFFFLLFF